MSFIGGMAVSLPAGAGGLPIIPGILPIEPEPMGGDFALPDVDPDGMAPIPQQPFPFGIAEPIGFGIALPDGIPIGGFAIPMPIPLIDDIGFGPMLGIGMPFMPFIPFMAPEDMLGMALLDAGMQSPIAEPLAGGSAT